MVCYYKLDANCLMLGANENSSIVWTFICSLEQVYTGTIKMSLYLLQLEHEWQQDMGGLKTSKNFPLLSNVYN